MIFKCSTCGWNIYLPEGSGVKCVCGTYYGEKSKHSELTRPTTAIRNSATAWRELHLYAIKQFETWDSNTAEVWFKKWCETIPAAGCDCRKNWKSFISEKPPSFDTPQLFFRWTVEAHNHVSTNHVNPPKPTMELKEAEQLYGSPWKPSIHHLLTFDDLTRDSATLASIIATHHPDLSGVAGVPRSGMRAATDIALRLGVPLYEASATKGLYKLDNGERIKYRKIPNGPIALVEDSSHSGNSINQLRKHIDLKSLPAYAVYATQRSQNLLTGWAVSLEQHWFDWHIFHCNHILQSTKAGTDWDGVLNPDCSPIDDDDGVRYSSWIKSVKPLRYRIRIPVIITARLEAYRSQCSEWLDRYSIKTGKLVMFQGSFEDRKKTNLGEWKAAKCREHGVKLYIESDYQQAKTIAQLNNHPVISIENPCSGLHP